MSLRLRHYIRNGLRSLALITLFVLGANLIVLAYLMGEMVRFKDDDGDFVRRNFLSNRPFDTSFLERTSKWSYSWSYRMYMLFRDNLHLFCMKIPMAIGGFVVSRFAWNCVWIIREERRSASEWSRFLIDGHIPASEFPKDNWLAALATQLPSLGADNGIRLFVNRYLTRFNPSPDQRNSPNGRRIESNSPRNINDRETAAKFEESIRPCLFHEILKRYPGICCCQFPAEGSDPIWRGLVSSMGDREHWRFFYCFQVDRKDLVTNVSGVAWYFTRFASQRDQAMGRLRGDEDFLVPPWWRAAGGLLLKGIVGLIPLVIPLTVTLLFGFVAGTGRILELYSVVETLVYMLPLGTCISMLVVLRKKWYNHPFTDWDPEEWKWNARFGDLGIWSLCQDVRTSEFQSHPKSVPMPASLASKLEGMFNAMEEATQSAITDCARTITQSHPPESGKSEKPSSKGKGKWL